MRYLDTWTRDDAPPCGGFRLRPRSIEMICPNRFERLQLSSFVPDTGMHGFLVEWTVVQSSETGVLKQGGHAAVALTLLVKAACTANPTSKTWVQEESTAGASAR